MSGKIQVVVGGQFGSEGKGHCAAELAQREGQMLAIRTGGPNAGHTVIGDDPALPLHRHEFKLRQLPVAPVVNGQATAAIAARSLVQLDLVEREVKEVGLEWVWVDPAATVLESAHITVEQADDALMWGSTQKGIGAARMDRLHRTARCFDDVEAVTPRMMSRPVMSMVREYLGAGHTVQIEAAQGYGLGLHTEFYPKTTSADCRAIDALADVGISPWEFPDTALEVWVVIRPHPIRVAGDSGPLKFETTWAALGLPEERTTVTNKVRRVGTWDPSLVAKAVRANGTRDVKLWMNMADHVFPFLSGRTSLKGLKSVDRAQVNHWIARVQEQVNAKVCALGTGPDTAIFLGGH
jgi:adenylosuccinate synthase